MTHPVLAAFDALFEACKDAAKHGPAAVGVALTPQGALPALYDAAGTRWAFATWRASAHQRLALCPHVQRVEICGKAWRKATLKVYGLRELFGTGMLVVDAPTKTPRVHWCPARERSPEDWFEFPSMKGRGLAAFRGDLARCIGASHPHDAVEPRMLFDGKHTIRLAPKTTQAMAEAYLPAMPQGGEEGYPPFVGHNLLGFRDTEVHTVAEERLQAARAHDPVFATIRARLAALAARRPHDVTLFQITGLVRIAFALQTTRTPVSNRDAQGRVVDPRAALEGAEGRPTLDANVKGWAHAVLDVLDDLRALLPPHGTWQVHEHLFGCHFHHDTPEDEPLMVQHLLGLTGTGQRWFAVVAHAGIAAQLVQAKDALEAAGLVRAAGKAKIVHNRTFMVCEVDRPPAL